MTMGRWMIACATVALAAGTPKNLKGIQLEHESDPSVLKENKKNSKPVEVVVSPHRNAIPAAGTSKLSSNTMMNGLHGPGNDLSLEVFEALKQHIIGSPKEETITQLTQLNKSVLIEKDIHLKQGSGAFHMLQKSVPSPKVVAVPIIQADTPESSLMQKDAIEIEDEKEISGTKVAEATPDGKEAAKKVDVVAVTKQKKDAENAAFVGPHGSGEAGIVITEPSAAGPAGTDEKDKEKTPASKESEVVGNGQYCGNPKGIALTCLEGSMCLDSKQEPCGGKEPEKVCKCYETAVATKEGDKEVQQAANDVIPLNSSIIPDDVVIANPTKSPLRSMFQGYYGVMVVAFLILLTMILLSRGSRRYAAPDVSTPTMLEEWRTFLNCPSQLRLALILTFLDSIRFFCGVSAMPLLLSNEYGFSDSSASAIAAHCVLVAVVFGFGGAYLVDRYDSVVNISRVGTSLSFISRMILVFFSSGLYGNEVCLLCALFLFPFVEGCLGPSFRTAIVRLSTNETRSFNFAMLYATQSLGGAFGFMIVDLVKDQVHTVGGFTMSGIRFTFFISGIVMGCAAVLSLFMADERLDSLPTGDEQETSAGRQTSIMPNQGPAGLRSSKKKKEKEEGEEEAALLSTTSDSSDSNSNSRQLQMPVSKPWYSSMVELFRSRSTWKVLTFSIFTTFTCTQWQFAETLLPKFLTRIHGTSVPWGSISSLNMWGCVFGPPIAAAVFSEFEDFDVIIPGIILFALSPLCMVACDSHLIGSVLWMILMTIGEVIWSPRFQAYAASLCPPNQQAMFLTLVAMPRILFSWIGTLMGGILLDMFVPPCPQCADDYGFFCDVLSDTGCKSSVSGLSCGNPTQNKFCAPTCQDCPKWAMEAETMWCIILGLSIVSPILIAYNRDYFGASMIPERTALKIKASKV